MVAALEFNDPKFNFKAYIRRASARIKRGKYIPAISDLDAALLIQPGNKEALVLREEAHRKYLDCEGERARTDVKGAEKKKKMVIEEVLDDEDDEEDEDDENNEKTSNVKNQLKFEEVKKVNDVNVKNTQLKESNDKSVVKEENVNIKYEKLRESEECSREKLNQEKEDEEVECEIITPLMKANHANIIFKKNTVISSSNANNGSPSSKPPLQSQRQDLSFVHQESKKNNDESNSIKAHENSTPSRSFESTSADNVSNSERLSIGEIIRENLDPLSKAPIHGSSTKVSLNLIIFFIIYSLFFLFF